MKRYLNKIIQGDTLKVLKEIPNEFVDCIVTSPPYFGLRNYGIKEQIGMEDTFEEYLEKLLKITNELKRVLKKTGTFFLNLGDSYASGGGIKTRFWHGESQGKHKRLSQDDVSGRCRTDEFPHKSLILQPYRLAQQMIDEQEWRLRNIIVWYKSNVMPSSAKDRFTIDWEPVLFFVKSKKYWFEQQLEPHKEVSIKRAEYGLNQTDEPMKAVNVQNLDKMGKRFVPEQGKNKRTVWKICTEPHNWERELGLKGIDHFAIFPKKLIEIPIKAGCPKNGIVLDPFMGAGTTALVAQNLGRNFIGIELNPDYIKIAKKRLSQRPLL